jgi:hypothetical protein
MPAAAIAIPAAGAVLGALGANQQAKATKSAAQTAANAALPYNIQNGLMGDVSFQGKNAYFSPTSQTRQTFDQLNGLQNQYFGGTGPNAGFQQFSQNVGNQQLPGIFGNAINQAGIGPDQAFNLNQGQMQGLFNSYGQQGAANLGQQQQLFGQAQGIAGQNTQGISDNYLNILRQQAAPQDARNMDLLANSAFNSGQLGGPGGRAALQTFGDQLNQADLGRQQMAQNLGLQQQQQNLGVAGLFGNMGSQLGTQGMQFASALPGISQNAYNTAAAYNDLGNTRAQQMLSNASGLFGFGANMGQQDFSNGLSALQAQLGLQTSQNSQAALGANIASGGGSAAAAVAPLNASSPVGSFLGGLGTGLFNTYQPQQAAQNPTFSSAWSNMGSNPSGAGLMSPGTGVMQAQPVRNYAQYGG